MGKGSGSCTSRQALVLGAPVMAGGSSAVIESTHGVQPTTLSHMDAVINIVNEEVYNDVIDEDRIDAIKQDIGLNDDECAEIFGELVRRGQLIYTSEVVYDSNTVATVEELYERTKTENMVAYHRAFESLSLEAQTTLMVYADATAGSQYKRFPLKLQGDIRNETGMTRAQVSAAFKELVGMKWLERETRYGKTGFSPARNGSQVMRNIGDDLINGVRPQRPEPADEFPSTTPQTLPTSIHITDEDRNNTLLQLFESTETWYIHTDYFEDDQWCQKHGFVDTADAHARFDDLVKHGLMTKTVSRRVGYDDNGVFEDSAEAEYNHTDEGNDVTHRLRFESLTSNAQTVTAFFASYNGGYKASSWNTPTFYQKDIMEWTGMPRAVVKETLQEAAAAGVINQKGKMWQLTSEGYKMCENIKSEYGL